MNAKHNKQPGARPNFEALAAATASGPGDLSDRGKRLSCDGMDYTFDCAGGTIWRANLPCCVQTTLVVLTPGPPDGGGYAEALVARPGTLASLIGVTSALRGCHWGHFAMNGFGILFSTLSGSIKGPIDGLGDPHGCLGWLALVFR